MALPAGIGAIPSCRAFGYGEGIAVGLERLTKLVQSRQQTALQSEITITAVHGVEALGNCEAITVGFESKIEAPLRQKHVTNFHVRQRKFAGPFNIAAIAGNEMLGYGEALAVGFIGRSEE